MSPISRTSGRLRMMSRKMDEATQDYNALFFGFSTYTTLYMFAHTNLCDPLDRWRYTEDDAEEEDNSDCEKDGYENADDDFNLRNEDK